VDYSLSKVLKTSRKLLKELNKKPLLISFGLFLFFLGASRYYELRVLSFTETPAQIQTADRGAVPAQITIPSLKIDIQVNRGSTKDGVWQISYENATFLDSSETPGSEGNTVIYGHNKKVIFGNLPYLSIGQKVVIKTQDGKLHIYEVYKKEFVKPDRIDLVSPTDYEELTLFTCWGLFDSQRVVVKAKPV